MKAIIILTTLLNLNWAWGHQLPTPTVLDATFEDMQIQHANLKDSIYGRVTVDLENEEIEIMLQQPTDCPKGKYCIALAPAPVFIRLPITEIFDDWCGSTTYIAEKNLNPEDRISETITVTDYTSLVCRIQVPFATEVQYRTYNPWTNQTIESLFSGDRLTERPQYHF